MMNRRVGAVCFILILGGPAAAGELVLTNGSRLHGELVNEVLVVSTGTDLVEVAPEQVGVLTADEVRLRDGRVIRGTLVGGHVRVRTLIGEIGVKPGELRMFRADGVASTAPSAGPSPTSEPAVAAPTVARAATTGASPSGGSPGAERGLPSDALYQAPAREPGANPPAQPSSPPSPAGPRLTSLPPGTSRPLAAERRLEVVVSEARLRRDALANAEAVGRVVRGEQVTYVDFIDRRLRILNVVIYDGGHWIKVRAADGSVGWIPARAVQEIR